MTENTDPPEPRRTEVPGGQGVQIGNQNTQNNQFIQTYVEHQVVQLPALSATGSTPHGDPLEAQPGAMGRPALRAYLTAARAAARQHPYAVALPGAPSLSTVYLRQQVSLQATQPLSPETDEANDRLHSIEMEEDTSLRRRQSLHLTRTARVTTEQIKRVLEKFDVNEMFDRNRGGFIIGGPGLGKSSLLRNLVETSAGNWLDDKDGAFVPVLIKAKSLLQPLPLPEAIAQAIMGDLGARLDKIDLAGLLAEAAMPGIPWLILLDGLDEILDAGDRQQVIEIMTRWLDDRRYRFFMTSRPLPQREFQALRSVGVPVFELQPFTDEQLPLLAHRWFAALGVPNVMQTVDLFVGQLLQTRIVQLARNPLIATISCVVFANSAGRELPRSRADLYEEFVTLLLRKPFTQSNSLESIKDRLSQYGDPARRVSETLLSDLRALLQDLALMRINGSELSLRAAAEQLSAKYRPSPVPASLWNEITAELLRQSGLLAERSGDFAFIHDTIMEYLAACSRSTSSRLRIRERWSLEARAGENESFALFMVALLRRRGVDLTRRIPAFLKIRKLLHARLVAAVVHDGGAIEPKVVQATIERLSAMATMRTNSIPDVLRRGAWLWEDDCVMAAKSLMMLDKNRGFELLVRLAADPTVAGLNIVDVFAERMLTEDFSDIDPALGLHILSEAASVPSGGDADPIEDRFRRMLIADFVFDRDADIGSELIGRLAEDPSMDVEDRMDCVRKLVECETVKATEIVKEVLAAIIADVNVSLCEKLDRYNFLLSIDQPTAVAALENVASDPVQGDFIRAMAAMMLYRDAHPEGVVSLCKLSGDRGVAGFHRVFHFAMFGGEYGQAAGRLAGLSYDHTLPGEWRIFAAEELIERDPEQGIDALRAIQRDSSVGRYMRAKARVRAVIYHRALAVLEVADWESPCTDSWSLTLWRFVHQLGELTRLLVRGT